MLLEFLQANTSAIIAVALTALIVALRFFFWHIEMRELRMHGHSQKPVTKKQQQAHKRTAYADAA
jgi:hypothetical protein